MSALDAFWEKGYEATSMADLVKATGMHKGSLYQAFGDKKALFMAALRAYVDTMEAQFRELAAQAPSPRAAIEAVMDAMIETAAGEGSLHRGCLLLKTLTTTSACDAEVKALVQGSNQKFFDFMRALVKPALSAGAPANGNSPDKVPVDERAPIDVDMATGLLLTATSGLVCHVKSMLSPDQARALSRQQIALVLGG